jgi:hypothetical protein
LQEFYGVLSMACDISSNSFPAVFTSVASHCTL